MKKIILSICLILLTTMNVNAYQIVNYNSAGGVTSVTNTGYYGRNYYNTTSTNPQFGSNAIFTPKNRAIIAEKNRQIRNEEKYLDSLKNTKNVNVNVNTNGMYYPYRGNNYLYNNNGYYYNNGYNYYSTPRIYGNNGIYYNQGNGFSIPGIRMF